MGTDPALPQAQACGTNDPAPENSFRFTPIKALRALPRLWERKPSTPFRAGLNTKKLWKRFHSSFSTMKTLEQSSMMDNDALQTAINASKDTAYVRGVKRLRVGSDEEENRADVGSQQPGRSFLETRWESEASRKRRKLPGAPFDIYDENLQNTSTSSTSRADGPANDSGENDVNNNLGDIEGDLAMTASPTPLSNLRSPSKTAVFHDAMHIENLNSPLSDAKAVEKTESRPTDQEQCAMINSTAKDGTSNEAPVTTTAVRDLTQEQEGTLVRSALRSSLDGEDAELLNDFLSKAKAKRAAKVAQMNGQETEVAEKSSSPEESPEECSTPRSRRALEALDTNSPSPVKVQVSPSKGESIPGDEAQEDTVRTNAQDDEPAPASPACRRSTRAKAPPANAHPVRNTISLRRAKGTEFVFLQRTEAQELALATKRNTRNNKGSSVLPKYALQAMAEQHNEDSPSIDTDRPGRSDRKGFSNRQPAAAQKHVLWNDECLVEYEGYERQTREDPEEEEGDSYKDDVDGAPRARSGAKRSEKKATTSDRSSRSQELQKADRDAASDEPESGPTPPTTAPASATPRSRRVRRLGNSSGVSGTPVKTGSGRISKPPVTLAPAVAASGPSTPTKARRKLTPKSPRSSLLPAPTSKGAGITTDPPFVSGIPTRGTISTSSSEGTKRKSMIQASAGCTPMPRRVRTRT